jgi:hypothetical protein
MSFEFDSMIEFDDEDSLGLAGDMVFLVNKHEDVATPLVGGRDIAKLIAALTAAKSKLDENNAG